MDLKLNFNEKTLLKDWWKIIKENLITIGTNHEKHRTEESLDHPAKSVKQTHIADGAVGNKQLANRSVTTDKLAQNSVISDRIAENSVSTSKLTSNCVTSAKIFPGAVLANHIKDGVITEKKLDADLQNRINSFLDEIADGSITWDKLNGQTQSLVRNYLDDLETYNYCANNFTQAAPDAMLLSFSSKYGAFIGSPPDTSKTSDGYIKYIMMSIKAGTDTLQIAVNVASRRRYIRTFEPGNIKVWQNMNANHPSTVVIGTTDVFADGVDYVCSGTNDEQVINNAVNDLSYNGGKIILREGTYNISSPIMMDTNISIEGMGSSTCLNYIGTGSSTWAMFDISGIIDVTISNMYINGNYSTYHSEGQMFFIKNCSNITLSDIHIHDAADTAVLTNNAADITIRGNTITKSGYDAISCVSSSDIKILDNYITQTNDNYDIKTDNQCDNIIISNNICKDNNTAENIYIQSPSSIITSNVFKNGYDTCSNVILANNIVS